MQSKSLKTFALSTLLILVVSIVFVALSSSSVAAQGTVPTSTPNSLGQIKYKVEAGDSCWGVAEKFGIDYRDIIAYNGLKQDCPLIPGTEITVAQVTVVPITPTKAPTATPDPALITPGPTPSGGAAKVCTVLFNDLNGNSTREEGETYLYGGVVSINDTVGKVSQTGKTVAGDPVATSPFCFNDIPDGTYTLTMAIPDDFNPTTSMTHPITVKAGEVATIDFGAQEKAPQPIVLDEPASGGKSPVLGILGAVLLIAGIGLGYYMWRNRKG